MLKHEQLPPLYSQLFSHMADEASKHHPELFKPAMVLALGQNCCECVNKEQSLLAQICFRSWISPSGSQIRELQVGLGWLTLTHPSSGGIYLEIKDRASSAAGVPQGA